MNAMIKPDLNNKKSRVRWLTRLWSLPELFVMVFTNAIYPVLHFGFATGYTNKAKQA